MTGHIQHNHQLNLPWQSFSCDTQALIFYIIINDLGKATQQCIEYGSNFAPPRHLFVKVVTATKIPLSQIKFNYAKYMSLIRTALGY